MNHGLARSVPAISLPIRTERLLLRRFDGGDLDAFHAYRDAVPPPTPPVEALSMSC